MQGEAIDLIHTFRKSTFFELTITLLYWMELLDKAIADAKLSITKGAAVHNNNAKCDNKNSVSCVTWNLCGSMPNFIIDRIEHALKTLTSSAINADLICLQEVPLEHLAWIVNRLKVLDFNICHSITQERPLGELTALRYPITNYEYVAFVSSDTNLATDFGMNFVEFDYHGRSCLLVNSQLDFSADCKARREQLEDLITLLCKSETVVIVCMDSNFRSIDPEPWLPPKWMDSWEQYGNLCNVNKSRKFERCFTLDSARNPHVLYTYGESRHRPDRIFVYNGDRKFRWSLNAFGLLGTKAFKYIDNTEIFVSDHFGVWNRYTIEELRYIPKSSIVVA